MKKYDERSYLVSEDLSFCKENKVNLETCANYEASIYDRLIEDYDIYIEIAAQLIKDLDVCDNPIAKTIIINRLIDNGFFSSTGKHQYKENPNFELQSKMGFNVILGKGCCRNVTCFHKDIFEKLDEYFDLYFCKSNHRNLPLNRMQANVIDHVVSIIKPNEDNIIGYDMSYDIFLRPINGYQMDVLRGYKGKHNIIYKPYGEYIALDKTVEELRENVKKYEEASRKEFLSLGNIVDMRTECEESLVKNYNLLDLFHKETKPLVKEMTKETKKKIKSYI